MRIFFLFITFILVLFLVLQGRLHQRGSEKPIFMQNDLIADLHQTEIDIKIHSLYRPDSFQLSMLKKDYSNIWAHLNYLYQTNDVEKGKEYYSEKWFRQISNHYKKKSETMVTRRDRSHQLHIMNWSEDGLICNMIDSNIVLDYNFPNKTSKSHKNTIAFALVFQGDHWRIDAMKVLE
jgi:hypothetical protein